MGKQILDKSVAINNLKRYIEMLGRENVKYDGIENSAVFICELGNSKKSIETELSNILGLDVSGYTVSEICKLVFDNARELSVSWAYQFNYNFIKSSNKLRVEIYKMKFDKLTQPNLFDVVNDNKSNIKVIEKGERKMNKKNTRGKSVGYTEEEFNYYEKLYTKGKLSAAEQYRNKDNSGVTSQLKTELGDKFKSKYPKYNGIDNASIWYAFYKKRIYKINPDQIKKDVVVNDANDNINKGRKSQDYYTNYIKDYVSNVGVGTYTMNVTDFIKNVLYSNSFINRPKLSGGFRQVVRNAKISINKDNDFSYIVEKISIKRADESIDDYSAKNMNITIVVNNRDIITEVKKVKTRKSSVKSTTKKVCLVKYNISFSVDYYKKKSFGSDKYLHTLNIPMELVVKDDILEDELDYMVRDNISYILKQTTNKIYGVIKQYNDKDYNIVGKIPVKV